MNYDSNKQLNRLHEAYVNGDISRRDFVKLLSIACTSAGLLLTPAGRIIQNSWAGSNSIRFDSWGGVVSEAFRKFAFDPFTAQTGIKVIDGEFGNQDTYLSKVKASFPPGGEFNIANLSGVFEYAKYIGLGFGVVLDENKIPNLVNVMPSMMEPLRAVSGGNLSAVPYTYGQTGIGYNTKFISKEKAEELGAALLWQKDLKGRIGSWTDWKTNIWYAALYTNQDPNDIKDLEKIWSVLKEQRKLMKKYWASGAELMSLLANQEIYATVAWSGRVAALQEQGHPIGYLAPPNTYSWQECQFVMKGTDLDVACKLLNFMLTPECAIAVSKGSNYPISLDPTKIKMPEEVKNLPAFDPTGKMKGYLFATPDYWNGHQIDWAEKWDRIMAGV